MGVFNSRSICNKTAGVFDLLSDFDIDVCFLTETWLRKGDTSKIAEIKNLGYNLFQQSRPGRGGGVAIAFKKQLSVKKQNAVKYKSFELVESTLISNANELLRFSCIYRSCTAQVSNIKDFFEDFDNYLNSIVHLPGKLVLAGDFNIHMENINDPDVRKFQLLLQQYDLTQHIDCATHISNGILDLVLTRTSDKNTLQIKNVEITQTVTTSDHFLLSFSCMFPHHLKTEQVIASGRKVNDIDIKSFKTDILSSELCNIESLKDCNTATYLYNQVLSNLLDKHAPMHEFKVNPYQDKWVNSEVQSARRKRRKAERDFKRLKTEESRKAYRTAYKDAEDVINTRRDSYFCGQLEQSLDNKKDTYKIVNNLMDRNTSRNIKPNSKPDEVLSEELKDYFQKKVEEIYCNLDSTTVTGSNMFSEFSKPWARDTWKDFEPLTYNDLDGVIRDINKKEYEDDPIPVKLLMQCLEEVKPIILFIVNDSLKTGIFPEALKSALVRPSIKDENGDTESYKNYRPISNLPFLSKVIEKSVHRQLENYLQRQNLHAEFQSGYKSHHSCETATLAIYNDLLCITDSKSKIILLLLDLSAAFDTVNHSLLLQKLRNSYGLSGNVLKWFKSYLSDRSFTVSIGKHRSSKCFLRIGVPQGSILGPILFILYTKELINIAKKHGFFIHLYADDTQLYIEFNPLSQSISHIEERIVSCLTEIKNWMTTNKLKLNPDKTEVLIASSINRFTSWSNNSLSLISDGENISPMEIVKSLGVRFDKDLSFEDHINSVVKACYIQLRNLQAIGSKLNYDLKKQLIHCLIFSKLDYCNGLFFGLPDKLIKKLQKVQNSCVRFLFQKEGFNKWDSVSPLLERAHFLPIRQRIVFKIALTVFKCLNNIAPSYLRQCIRVKDQPLKTLRTDLDYFLLQKPPVSHLVRTERGFSYCGPNIWNNLPYHLRTCNNILQFKKLLKTHLFKEAFCVT